MTSAKSVFLIGPGFIGAELLTLLLEENYTVTTLARRPAYGAELEKLGAKVIVGSLDDKDLITHHASRNDITIHTATADHLPSVEAVLAGINQGVASDPSTVPIFIHTSGASQLSDDSHGDYKGDKIFSDATPNDIDALPDSASHREIDLAILRGRKALGDRAKIAIILPPLIYGVSRNVDPPRLSIQLPTLTRFALKHGFAPTIGKGESVWSQIHVSDLTRAYMTLLHYLESPSSNRDIQANPYFFAENGHECSWYECAAEIGRSLHAAGRISDPTPKTVPKDLYSDLMGQYSAWVVGSNSRSRGTRVRKLGWEPKEKGTIQSLRDDEIPIILKEDLDGWKGYAKVSASGSG